MALSLVNDEVCLMTWPSAVHIPRVGAS